MNKIKHIAVLIAGTVIGYYSYPLLNKSEVSKDLSSGTAYLQKKESIAEPIKPEKNIAKNTIQSKNTITLADEKHLTKKSIEVGDSLSGLTEKLTNLTQSQFQLTEEQEALGSKRLKELKDRQPLELKELFAKDPELASIFEPPYKKHLSEEKDINWAYEAESFLENFFRNQPNSQFKVLRIDCRTNNCEVAGLLTTSDSFDYSNPIDVINITQIALQIQLDILDSTGGKYLFSFSELLGTTPMDMSKNPFPQSFFMGRAKQK